MREDEEASVVTVDSEDIKDLLSKAVVMPPITAVGAHVCTEANPSLVTEDVVTTIELLVLTPSPEGDQMAIFTIIMDPELASSLGLQDTNPKENK